MCNAALTGGKTQNKMKEELKIQSRINTLKARKEQMKHSDLFNDEEKDIQINIINKGISDLEKKLTDLESDRLIKNMAAAEETKINYQKLI